MEDINEAAAPVVKGQEMDNNTRCRHYHSPLDIIAIKFSCCGAYYCCYYCHSELAGHEAVVWKKEAFGENAVLCGNCKKEMSVNAYKASHYQCPYCHAPFNPRCAGHDHLYFEV